MTARSLSGWVRDADVRAQYLRAFERSDFAAMLNFYKANYPRSGENSTVAPSTPPPAAGDATTDVSWTGGYRPAFQRPE